VIDAFEFAVGFFGGWGQWDCLVGDRGGSRGSRSQSLTRRRSIDTNTLGVAHSKQLKRVLLPLFLL
jgi:hypothetical protein